MRKLSLGGKCFPKISPLLEWEPDSHQAYHLQGPCMPFLTGAWCYWWVIRSLCRLLIVTFFLNKWTVSQKEQFPQGGSEIWVLLHCSCAVQRLSQPDTWACRHWDEPLVLRAHGEYWLGKCLRGLGSYESAFRTVCLWLSHPDPHSHKLGENSLLFDTIRNFRNWRPELKLQSSLWVCPKRPEGAGAVRSLVALMAQRRVLR